MVDAAIMVAVVGFGVLGWREGFVRALWGYTGLMLGTAAGIVFVPVVLDPFELSFWVSMASLAVVGACAVGTRFLAVGLERRLQSRLAWTPNPRFDRPAGTVFAAVATLGVSWMLGLAVAGSNLPGLSDAAKRSVALRLLTAVDLPLSGLLVRQFVHLGTDSGFPRYVDVFTPERIVDVPAPPAGIVDDPDVLTAAASVWRIVVQSGPVVGSQGSGFLVAPGRVMTAAHIVRDGSDIVVHAGGGQLPASVVVCDPVYDVAVLDVPGLDGRVLSFADAVSGDPAAIIGFPGNGPLTISAARIRERRTWQSVGIWGEGRYERDAYTVRARVRPGDSGGPLVTSAGRVLGVVVAASRTDPDTGYALTGAQVSAARSTGRSASPGAADRCD